MYVMVVDGFYPQDIRVRKEAESIVATGIPVFVIARWKKGLSRKESYNGVQIVRIGINYSHFVKGIHDILFSLFFIDFVFYFGLRKFIKMNSIKLLHVHDLPLVKTTKRLLGEKGQVILDMHENYPEMLEELTLSKKGIIKSLKDMLFFSVKHWKKYEKRVIHIPTHIIAVVDEMKEKLIREYLIPPERITIVSNLEKLDFASITETDEFEFKECTFYIAYVGGISPVRGLETVIEAISNFKKKNKKVEFILVGSGNQSYLTSLSNLAGDLNCSEQVHFLGQKPFSKINYFIENANVNIIPHIKNEHTDNTIPHKLFQIMMQKAPLLVSNCKPMERIVKNHDAGFVFQASNSLDLVEKIIEMESTPQLVVKRVQNAFQAVKEDLNWEKESLKLIELIKNQHG
jgi:glycosyltransferase involved in cell wall biosynthesis